jgi:uncharacterized protein (UPF0548 family)
MTTGGFTYPDVGATRSGEMPAGYRQLRARARVGAGPRVFAAAARGLRDFDMQRRAGLAVHTRATRVEPGVQASFGFGVGRLRLWAPCEVVWVVDEPDRYGYATGTLAGHPQSGEEAFEVSLEDDTVWFDVRVFSRPARWYTRLGGPASLLMQDFVMSRYRQALQRLATLA